MKIIKINPENNNLLNNLRNEQATILVFHPNCIHCVMLRDSWEAMKKKLQEKKKNFNIYEINGEYLHEMNHPLKQSVNGFPTIMNVKNGKVVNHFEKERNIENMMNYVLSNISSNKYSNSKKSLNSRRVRFNLNKNGSLMKTRKILNAKMLKNSLNIHRKTMKNKGKLSRKGKSHGKRKGSRKGKRKN